MYTDLWYTQGTDLRALSRHQTVNHQLTQIKIPPSQANFVVTDELEPTNLYVLFDLPMARTSVFEVMFDVTYKV